MLGKADYPLTGFSHQGWLDQDQGLFFMGDEVDELKFGMNTRTLMFDVRDLDNPVYAGAHLHATSVIDHNLYVNGNYLYQANYFAGLRILRIDRGKTTGLTEVAYFDTSPDQDGRDFGGVWPPYREENVPVRTIILNTTVFQSSVNTSVSGLKATQANQYADKLSSI